MDPFTQRMLERARARQEKIDQKLINSGQTPKRKPLAENVAKLKSDASPIKSPVKQSKETVSSPTKSSLNSVKSPNRRNSSQKSELITSPPRVRNDVIVTKREFKSPRNSKGSLNRRNSDVSVEINIMHRDNIQIEVQVEERDAPISVTHDSSKRENGVIIKEIEENPPKKVLELPGMEDNRMEKAKLRKDVKSRLDRLGNLYSDKPNLSSPIHRTEAQFTSATPPQADTPRPRPKPEGKKFGRLAALADQINNWEDDTAHHDYHLPEPVKKGFKPALKTDKHESSTLDVSIHSFKDINKALSSAKTTQSTKPVNSGTFIKSNECQRLNKQIVAELEGAGYRRVSASQSRLVYDFTTENADRARQEPKCASTTPSAGSAPNMATLVATPPTATVTKKPSIKKYKAPTPPSKTVDSDTEKDKENNDIQREENIDNADCIQTERPAEKGLNSPLVKRLNPKLNGNLDRNSVLSKAAMFEAGSPRAKEKDPAEMSLRERKALFEKNKGAAIVPKAPFGLAPSAKSLHGDRDNNKLRIAAKPSTPTKSTSSSITTSTTHSGTSSSTNSRDDVTDDNISQSSVGGGIKSKLAALFSKEQTISETTIANKFKQERDREMEMLQNRFNYKPTTKKPETNDSDEDPSDNDPSEKAPLMGSTTSLSQVNKKPEIIANVPKTNFDKTRSETALNRHLQVDKDQDKVAQLAQPVKRRSSQDSPVVLSVLEDVKRIKVNNNKKDQDGVVLQQPTSIYPHLSDIETDNSRNEEYSDCGGSSSEESPESGNNLNKSDNWAETSFGREVMNVVKRNNTSYKKAVRESSDSEESGAADSELDELLDEALGGGPTPPKVNKHGSLSSNSFVYQEQKFKSPLKHTPAPPAPRPDRGNELVHSVSFYRRMQNASLTPTTPLRVVRHASPERETPQTPADASAGVTTVRQRIKELHNEINKQQSVISQASQALNLCAATIEFCGSTEQAEGERLLLLATHRRQACLHEVQRLQVEGAGPAATAGMASLHINSLNIPLRRDYIRQLNADGAVGHHAVCLLKCRDRVLASSMQQTKPTSKILHFPDEIRMDGLSSDFKVTVEVYLLQASKENLPHDVKYHITNKKSSSKLLTPKSKVSELKTPRVQSPAGPSAVRSTQFQLHGYCIFALSQADRKSFTLSKVPHSSPFEGSMNVDIKARVQVPAPAGHSAFLTAFDDVSGLGAWHRRWFRLHTPTLAYWKYPDDVQKKLPIGDIDLSTVVSEKVTRAPRDLCARPNTLLIETSVPPGLVPESGSLVYVKRPDGSVVRRHLLAADTPKDRDMWLESLNKALEYVRCCSHNDD